MKPTRSIILSIVACCGLFLVAGCSSTPTRVDTGPIKAETFSFVPKRPTQDESFADKREAVHALIKQAIGDDLSARGLKQVENNGDVLIAYLVIVGNNATTESINTYFYGTDANALLHKAHEAYTGPDTPFYFESGTLLVDIIDGKTHELLWRSYVTRPLLRDATADVRAANIQEAVNALLKKLKITP